MPYFLALDPGCCLRAHIILIELVEPEKKKRTVDRLYACSPNLGEELLQEGDRMDLKKQKSKNSHAWLAPDEPNHTDQQSVL
jgi:hypothetical protein